MLNDRDALAADPVLRMRRCLIWPASSGPADRMVVAAPFWDLTFPAALRTYIEYISANGLTYHYEADGCHGDCRAEKLVYLTSGGDVERPESLGVLYWRQLCAMFGIGLRSTMCSPADWIWTRPRRRSWWSAAAELARRLAEAYGTPPEARGRGGGMRWRGRLSVWWAPRPAAKRSWGSCWQSGMTGKWSPPTPCRFTGA